MRRPTDIQGVKVTPAKTVILSDLQIPFQDARALDIAVRVIHVVKPDLIILNGDITDCYAISSFDKDPGRAGALLENERAQARKLLAVLSAYSTHHHGRLIWLGGNHEDRWRRLIWRERAVRQVVGALGKDDYGAFIGVKAFNAEFYPYGSWVDIGKLMVTHGEIVRRHSAYSAKAHFDKYGQSVVIGHTHRMGTYLHTNRQGVHGAWEGGCLCRLDPEYDVMPDWQQGLIVVDSVRGGNFQVTPVPIVRSGRGLGVTFNGTPIASTERGLVL